jgi:hypothetical protein
MKGTPKRVAEASVAYLGAAVRRRAKKVKTSVSVSAALLEVADAVAGKARRSALIERALRHYLLRILRRERHERELAILNGNAERLNAEGSRALADQAPLEEA